MREAMAPQVAKLIRQHHRAWIGGDHSITLPLLRAYRTWLGKPVAVIHFDVHRDTWEDHFNEPGGHGTWVYQAFQQGLVVNECFPQLGIRSAGAREAREYVRDPGGMTTNQVLSVLEQLADLPFVGMDCVEVAPPYDHAELTSYAAACFVWTYLCGRVAQGV